MVRASGYEIQKLVHEGFIVRRKLASGGTVRRLRAALSDVLAVETAPGNTTLNNCFASDYPRSSRQAPSFRKFLSVEDHCIYCPRGTRPEIAEKRRNFAIIAFEADQRKWCS
jgi:hypothetical protein